MAKVRNKDKEGGGHSKKESAWPMLGMCGTVRSLSVSRPAAQIHPLLSNSAERGRSIAHVSHITFFQPLCPFLDGGVP